MKKILQNKATGGQTSKNSNRTLKVRKGIQIFFPASCVVTFISLTLLLSGCNSSSDKNDVTATGTIEATESSIAAQVPGRIIKMNFEEGSLVKKGDTLAEIDHRSIVQQVNQAQAALTMAKQQYDLLVKGARSEDLRVAEEGVNQAKANFDLANSIRCGISAIAVCSTKSREDAAFCKTGRNSVCSRAS